MIKKLLIWLLRDEFVHQRDAKLGKKLCPKCVTRHDDEIKGNYCRSCQWHLMSLYRDANILDRNQELIQEWWEEREPKHYKQ